MVPRNSGGLIDASWIRPPFEEFVICSEKDEPGCLFVTSYSRGEMDSRHRGIGCAKDALWLAGVDVIVRNSRGHFFLACQTMFYANPDGHLHHPEWDRAHSLWKNEFVYKRALEAGLLLPKHRFDDDEFADSAEAFASVAFATMGLLCCKNVERRERQAPRQQRRAAERAGLPMVSWHELIVRPIGRSHEPTPGSGEPLALHWVRGHFKDYREKGIFGKVKGMFWWSPHMAGTADRVVLKDYRLLPTDLTDVIR